jgi:hypothetical protein
LFYVFDIQYIFYYWGQVLVRRKAWRLWVWCCIAWRSTCLWPIALDFQLPFWCLRSWWSSAYFLVIHVLCTLVLLSVYMYEIPFTSQLGLSQLFGRNQNFWLDFDLIVFECFKFILFALLFAQVAVWEAR